MSGRNGSERLFLLQMAGDPGSGKSALARAIGQATGAVVIDKDVLKTAALNAGAVESLAARIAYEAFFDLAGSLLAQGRSVVLDSPAFFPSITVRGRCRAEEAAVRYLLVECVWADREALASRLSGRERLRSQPSEPIEDPYKTPGAAPLTEPRLVVHTTRPLAECLREALEYVRTGVASVTTGQ